MHTRRVTLLLELVPFRDLLARAIHDLIPMVRFGALEFGPHFQSAHHFVLGHAIPVEDQELQGDVLETLIAGDVEEEGLVKDRVQGSLLDMGLLLGYTLAVIQ